MKKNIKKKENIVEVWVRHLRKKGRLVGSQFNFNRELAFFVVVGRETLALNINQFKVL